MAVQTIQPNLMIHENGEDIPLAFAPFPPLEQISVPIWIIISQGGQPECSHHSMAPQDPPNYENLEAILHWDSHPITYTHQYYELY